MATLKLKNLSKVYSNGYQAVKNINLNIDDKDFMVLVGPSGCGKTTTLRMIAGLEEISGGELFIDDKLTNKIQPKDRDIAMVFQNYALYPHMSVYENMAFGLKLRKMPKNDIKLRIENAANILGISHLLKNKPKLLSGGQRQRVALGRAIVRNPKVFLMDEPLSNLDAKLRVQMRSELIKLHKDLGTTFIYVTHDQTEAMTMGTKICIMNNGEIQQVAEPYTIYNNPANVFVASFIGTPQMNFVKGNISMNKDTVVLELLETKIDIPQEKGTLLKEKGYVDKTVIVGIRPEHISLCENGINSTVEITEMLGSETCLHLKAGNSPLIAKVSPDLKIKTGDKTKVSININKIHLFDEESEKSIFY